jgi:hypothetical protein
MWTSGSQPKQVGAEVVGGGQQRVVGHRIEGVEEVSVRSWVRRAWRQFLRQVTAASSHHTTSPGSGWSITSAPPADQIGQRWQRHTDVLQRTVAIGW